MHAIWGVGVFLHVYRVSYRILSFGRGGGGELQISVLTWKGYIAHNSRGVWGHVPPDFF